MIFCSFLAPPASASFFFFLRVITSSTLNGRTSCPNPQLLLPLAKSGRLSGFLRIPCSLKRSRPPTLQHFVAPSVLLCFLVFYFLRSRISPSLFMLQAQPKTELELFPERKAPPQSAQYRFSSPNEHPTLCPIALSEAYLQSSVTVYVPPSPQSSGQIPRSAYC